MENYVCTICGKVIKDFNNGLFVKIKDKEGNLLQVVPVHKGSCDDTLYKIERVLMQIVLWKFHFFLQKKRGLNISMEDFL